MINKRKRREYNFKMCFLYRGARQGNLGNNGPYNGMGFPNPIRAAEDAGLDATWWLHTRCSPWLLKIKSATFFLVALAGLIGPGLAGGLLQKTMSLARWLRCILVRGWRALLASQPSPGHVRWGRWRRHNLCIRRLPLLFLVAGTTRGSKHAQSILEAFLPQRFFITFFFLKRKVGTICVVQIGLGVQLVELRLQVGQKLMNVEILIAVVGFSIRALAIFHNCFVGSITCIHPLIFQTLLF